VQNRDGDVLRCLRRADGRLQFRELWKGGSANHSNVNDFLQAEDMIFREGENSVLCALTLLQCYLHWEKMCSPRPSGPNWF
jgi:hypothetical protein